MLPINSIINLSYLGLIQISGPDAAKFLQGQLTCDVREINEKQSRLGAYCNPKGRILATFRMFFYKDNYYLSLPVTMIDATLTQLQKYAIFSKVTLTNVSDNFLQLGFYGIGILQNIPNIATHIPLDIDETIIAKNFILIRISGEQRWLKIAEKNNSLISDESNITDNANYWHLLDINAGIATIFPPTREMFTPHMINYPQLHAVSFKKGCYLGQEIIARTEYLGKSKRHLYRGKITSAQTQPMPGDKLFCDHNEVGNIVNSAKLTADQYAWLAVIQEDATAQDIYLL